eukprot:15364833-Ditylum_brightwellii.AAC.1
MDRNVAKASPATTITQAVESRLQNTLPNMQSSYIRAIQLDRNDLERHRHIGHDRVPVEFFGRVCKLFGVTGRKSQRDEDKLYFDTVLASFRMMSDEAQSQNHLRQA